MSNPDGSVAGMEEWEESLRERYARPSQPADVEKGPEQFRDYESTARPSVREFYRLNHRNQTYDFAQGKRREYLSLSRRKMSIWQAAEFLNTLVDDSDPDTDLSQLEHLLQTAEQIRADGHPRWFVLVGFIHDLGKILCHWGEPQWAVVGDTFPTGCEHSDKIVFSQFFAENPDAADRRYQSPLGIYKPGCGLNRVQMSWGHDEYIYQVCKDYLPSEALYMLRYHSFYAWHHEGEYEHLTDEQDQAMLPWIKKFSLYDLYTKSHQRPDVDALRPYYEELIAEYFPAEMRW
jgi:inositol oxygenase